MTRTNLLLLKQNSLQAYPLAAKLLTYSDIQKCPERHRQIRLLVREDSVNYIKYQLFQENGLPNWLKILPCIKKIQVYLPAITGISQEI